MSAIAPGEIAGEQSHRSHTIRLLLESALALDGKLGSHLGGVAAR
jgi:hypothetical protein